MSLCRVFMQGEAIPGLRSCNRITIRAQVVQGLSPGVPLGGCQTLFSGTYTLVTLSGSPMTSLGVGSNNWQ